MADSKSKSKKGGSKKSVSKSTSKKKTSTEKTETKHTVITTKQSKNADAFFSKKYEGKETILSIFDSRKIIAVIVAEVLGTMILTMVLLVASMVTSILPVYTWIAILGIPLVFMAFSGAHFNPLLTAGMMASRRMSVSRGIVYIISQLIGAWFGFMIINAFRMSMGEAATELPTLEMHDMVWATLFFELIGAIIASFFFARAQAYRRSALSYATMVTMGFMTATFIVFCLAQIMAQTDATTGASSTIGFIFNPAIALVFQAIPIKETFAVIVQAICVYVVVPIVGGIIGFYISDFLKKMNGMKLVEEEQPRELTK